MTAIGERFRQLRQDGQGALIAYVTGGDPNPESMPLIIDSIIRGGADIIELGIPFSDPIADGPTIQAASVRALMAGTTPISVMEIAQNVKERHKSVPIALLTYYNPIFRMGLERFFTKARECGIDGVITPDLPVEEAYDYQRLATEHGIDTIFLATPATTTDRLEMIISHTSGFLYLVSVFGVTGAREKIQELTLQTIDRFLPKIGGRVPLAVGFGISEPEHVNTIIKSGADGAIVGSAFVKIVERYRDNLVEMVGALEEKASQLKAGTM